MLNLLLFMVATIATMTAFGLVFARLCSRPIPLQHSSIVVAERRDNARERAALDRERAALENERAALDAYVAMLDAYEG